jgi:hypothetical protein
MKKKLKGLELYAPFARMDEEARTVEGYCFVNEDVGSGLVWERAAMEEATPDYMRWANLREMHQNSAVGVTEVITWDERGAKIVAKVVDDAAWEKVKTGVYKGFSARIKPVAMRGDRVTRCLWVENSLVDRPADPDCPIDSFRVVASADEYEVEDEPDGTQRAAFASQMPAVERDRLLYAAMEVMSNLVWSAAYGPAKFDEADLRASMTEFADYVVPLIMAGDQRNEVGESRIEGASVESLQRAETENVRLAGDLAQMEGELATARARVTELEALPRTVTPPVRYAQAVERNFNPHGAANPDTTALRQELDDLTRSLPSEPDQTKRVAGATQIGILKQKLAAHGG